MRKVHNQLPSHIIPGMKVRLIGPDPFQGGCWGCFETIAQIQEDGILIFDGFEELKRYTTSMNWEIKP